MSDTLEESGTGEASGESSPSAGSREHPQANFAYWLMQVRLAIAFLTILPAGPKSTGASSDIALSFGWFPLVGFGIGLILCFADWLLAPLVGHAIRAVLIVLILTVLTGALHLDGVADTADALGAWHNRERALDILRDSRIGSFGAIALYFVLALKMIAIAGSAGAQRYAMLYAAPGLGRWAMVAVASGLDYARAAGAGSLILARHRRRNLWVATLIAILALAPLVTLHGFRACLIAALATIALRLFYRRWIGGVTGDLIGAAGELVETAVLIGLAG
ncbi:MAG TPA: adenosylcobinamide-GDP ribazoletransferase [Candidatus Binataceae bacterium]|jgi:adenosylcobinamide-GDP ribazoletransferase|nr:adenosylcobinamide-GDP ribazoletransferase [Candidatus Binataceae bacterium]